MVVALLFIGLACSNQVSTTIYWDDLRSDKNISRQVEAEVGKVIKLVFYGAPEIGSHWGIANISDGSVVRQEPIEVSPSDGRQDWYFQVESMGESTITFEYTLGGEPIAIYTVRIQVTAT